MNLTSSLARVVTVVFVAGAALPSFAQQAPAAGATPAVSPAKKELVKKALQLQQAGIESVGNGIANQTANQVMQITAPAVSRVPEDKRKALIADLQAEVQKFQNDIAPLLRASAAKWAPTTLGTALEEKFSEADLRVLIAWLESPVSRKYQQLSNEALQSLSQKIVADTRPQVEPKLKALEQVMVSKLNAATGTAAAAPSSTGPAAPAAPAAKK